MHKWTARAARVALVAAAVSAASVGVANADDTTGDHSILGGNQLLNHLSVIAPIGLFGNHVNLLSTVVPGSGFRYAHVRADDDPAPQMDICGNAISSANGIGTAACKGQANIGTTEAAPAAVVAAPAAPAAVTAPAPAMASETAGAPTAAIGAPGAAPAETAAAPAPVQAEAPSIAPAEAPAIASASAPAQAPAAAPAQAPAEAPAIAPAAAPAEPAAAAPVAAPIAQEARPVEMSTSGENGVLSGNQVKAPVRAPIRICGNAGALGGMATAACEGTASSGRIGTAARTFGVAGLLG
ncbi:chaplin family protein [Actinoallomurus iriomotensis]|nr:chaplin family protein [Actinoallomurus iriomotensis]